VTCFSEQRLPKVGFASKAIRLLDQFLFRSLDFLKAWLGSKSPVDFRPYLDGSFQWIIAGCEQAGVERRRAMNLDWVRDIDHQCREAGIAYFYKQRYEGNHILYDCLLDGEVRQAWPISPAIAATC
jgi:protein gp37